MPSSINSLTSIKKILTEVHQSHCLTAVNHYSLIAAMFDTRLPTEERQAVTQIILNVIQGEIKVIQPE